MALRKAMPIDELRRRNEASQAAVAREKADKPEPADPEPRQD